MGMDQAASQAVVETVAAAEDVDPTALGPPLYEAVDPGALDSLVESATGSLTVEFPYCGYLVRVDESTTVTLTAADRTSNTDSEPSTQASG